ncbi:MAG TPA: hypothetical protein VNY84_00675, partial [Acidimicrobiales bacterium]|nr:hypothetical protein [Acidimicrobiales bacterium]
EELDGRSRLAAHITRPAREGLIDHQALQVAWRERADRLRYSIPVPKRARSRPESSLAPLPRADHFSRADVVRAWCAHLTDGATPALIEQLADRSLAAALPITLMRAWHGSGRLDGPDGPTPRYTTSDVLRLRQELVDHARLELAVVAGAPGPSLRDALGPRRPGVVLIGASSGTHWAQRFERATGIVCGTLSAVAETLARSPSAGAPVILIEHGHRVPTIELAALARRAGNVGSRVVLLAEPDQQRWSETFALLAQRRGIAHTIESDPARMRRMPPQVVAALGPAPKSLIDRCRWRDAADALTAYRERWQITGDRALGGPPVTVEQRAERRQVERSVARVIGLSREGPRRALTR